MSALKRVWIAILAALLLLALLTLATAASLAAPASGSETTLLSPGLVFPDPWMPPPVRKAHLLESPSSTLAYGIVVGWVWTRSEYPGEVRGRNPGMREIVARRLERVRGG